MDNSPDEHPQPDQSASERAVPFYQKIGRLIASWNGAERTMKATAGDILCVPLEMCELVMGSTQIRANWAVYSKLINTYINHPKILKIFSEADSTLEDIYGFRNDIVHGIWYIGKDGEFVISRRLNPFEKQKSLSLLDHYIHRTRAFDLRLKAIRQMCGLWMELRRATSPETVARVLPLLEKCRVKLDRDLDELGPAPPKDDGVPPPASPPSPKPPRPPKLSSAQKRALREKGELP